MDMSSMVMTTCNTSMLWNWNTIDSCFLSETWHIGSNGAFAATCIGTILLVMAMEALRRMGKEYDDWILRTFHARAAGLTNGYNPTGKTEGDPLLLSKNPATTTVVTTTNGPPLHTGRTVVFRASPLQQVVRSVLHAVTLGVAYVVMLLVMSYNGYVIFCVIIGGGLGKFFCDWMSRRVVVGGVGGGEEEEGVAGLEEPSVCCG